MKLIHRAVAGIFIAAWRHREARRRVKPKAAVDMMAGRAQPAGRRQLLRAGIDSAAPMTIPRYRALPRQRSVCLRAAPLEIYRSVGALVTPSANIFVGM